MVYLMNKMTKQLRKNICLNLLRISNRKINEIRVGNNESKDHRAIKTLICNKLLSEGKDFVTEAIFKSGGRADILILEEFKAIEILKTEKESNILNKKLKYPRGIVFEIVKIAKK